MESEKEIKNNPAEEIAALINDYENKLHHAYRILHDKVSGSLFALQMNLNIQLKPLLSSDLYDENLSLLNETTENVTKASTSLNPSTLFMSGLLSAINEYNFNLEKDVAAKINLYENLKNLKLKINPEIQINIYRLYCNLLNHFVQFLNPSSINVTLNYNNDILSIAVATDSIDKTKSDNKITSDEKLHINLSIVKARIISLNAKISPQSNWTDLVLIEMPYVTQK